MAKRTMIGQTSSGDTKRFDRTCILYALLLYLGATMVGLGVVYTGSIFASKASGSTPYAITLVETMNVNSTIPQPRFYALGSNGLESSASISLPVNRPIQLTIVSYDMPTPGSPDTMGQVTGTVGGNVYLVNGTIATYGNATWGKTVTSVPGAILAHTFTISELGINIPVVGGSTVIANLYFDKAKTYTWICVTPCGSGNGGAYGAMSTSGWMTGQIVVR